MSKALEVMELEEDHVLDFTGSHWGIEFLTSARAEGHVMLFQDYLAATLPFHDAMFRHHFLLLMATTIPWGTTLPMETDLTHPVVNTKTTADLCDVC